MTTKIDKRKDARVQFARGIDVHIAGIDGTWRRACVMWDIAESGAKLSFDSSIEDLKLKEFFLILSSAGKVFRRCELAWVNGDQIGVRFLSKSPDQKTLFQKVSAN